MIALRSEHSSKNHRQPNTGLTLVSCAATEKRPLIQAPCCPTRLRAVRALKSTVRGKGNSDAYRFEQPTQRASINRANEA